MPHTLLLSVIKVLSGVKFRVILMLFAIGAEKNIIIIAAIQVHGTYVDFAASMPTFRKWAAARASNKPCSDHAHVVNVQVQVEIIRS